jgi:ribosomal protein L7Ae-like RNA K-turn-binding protein
MVDGPDGQILFDLSGGALGRGAWTHPTEACLKRTAKALRGTARSNGPGASALENDVSWSELSSALSDAASRRARGLVSSAYRGGHVALGTDASAAEYAEGRARLVLLASDARAASKESWLEPAVNHGKVVVWSTKAELGALVGRNELAVAVVTNDGLASSLANVLALTTPAVSRLAGATLAVARSQVTTMATGSHGLEDSEDG